MFGFDFHIYVTNIMVFAGNLRFLRHVSIEDKEGALSTADFSGKTASFAVAHWANAFSHP